jgi:hypothetical protein
MMNNSVGYTKSQKKRKEKLRLYLKYQHEGGPVGLLLIMVFHDAA